jgi:hypothetical protein
MLEEDRHRAACAAIEPAKSETTAKTNQYIFHFLLRLFAFLQL